MRALLLTLCVACAGCGEARPSPDLQRGKDSNGNTTISVGLLERIEARMNWELVCIAGLTQYRDFWLGICGEYQRPADIRYYGRICNAWARHVARLFTLQARLWKLIGDVPSESES